MFLVGCSKEDGWLFADSFTLLGAGVFERGKMDHVPGWEEKSVFWKF
jgi:hypothetical protein